MARLSCTRLFRQPVMRGGHHRLPELFGAGVVMIMGSQGSMTRRKPSDRGGGPGRAMMGRLKNPGPYRYKNAGPE